MDNWEEYLDENERKTTRDGGCAGAVLADRYRMVRRLGQGGMGSVLLAEDAQLDNLRVAIKMLPSFLVANKRAYMQLKKEALVSLKLSHPNIVTLRAFEENEGNPFLVMDYIDGVTLDDYLADYDGRVEHVERVEEVGSRVPRDRDGRAGAPRPPQGSISESEAVRLLKPIAAALDYAHSKGVVHRDVKPGNVMIAKDGTPYILDFGIAREIQETMTRVTGKLSSGTLLYMSPEQLNGDAPKPAQDIYSFAAMAYECLKGEPPFSRGNIEFQIMNKQPEPLRSDGALAVGVRSGLAKKPEDRPPTCIGVLEGKGIGRVERVERAEGVGTRTSAVPPRPAVPMTDRIVVRKKRNIAGIVVPQVCLVAALLVLGGVLWHREAKRQEDARRLAVEQRQEELRRRQAEDERKAQEAAAREKAEAERLAKLQQEEAQRKAEEDAKRREAEKQARERELARQKEEEARRAAEAEKAAIAAREKAEADKAMALQRGTRAFDLLARDPLQYELVSMDLTKDQRNLLSPLHDEVVRGEAYLKVLLEKFTELHPEVVGTRKEQNFRVANFKSVVKTLQNGNQPSASLASPTERFDDYLVKAGDSLAKIAISHGTSIAALKELNGLNDFRLTVGQKLKVPQKQYRNTNTVLARNENEEFVSKPSSKTEAFLKAWQERRFLAAAEMIDEIDQSNSVVQYNIAFMYLSGLGIAQNRDEGLKWLKRSAEQGYASAQTDLGIHYFHGEGLERNLDIAKALFVRAAEQGNAEAQRMLGGMCVYEIGTNRDRSKGIELLRKAAGQGDTKAKEALSELGEK